MMSTMHAFHVFLVRMISELFAAIPGLRPSFTARHSTTCATSQVCSSQSKRRRCRERRVKHLLWKLRKTDESPPAAESHVLRLEALLPVPSVIIDWESSHFTLQDEDIFPKRTLHVPGDDSTLRTGFEPLSFERGSFKTFSLGTQTSEAVDREKVSTAVNTEQNAVLEALPQKITVKAVKHESVSVAVLTEQNALLDASTQTDVDNLVNSSVGKLCVGTRVSLCGLDETPELNGSKGVLQTFDASKQRWRVLLDASSTIKLVRPCNLRDICDETAAQPGSELPFGIETELSSLHLYTPEAYGCLLAALAAPLVECTEGSPGILDELTNRMKDADVAIRNHDADGVKAIADSAMSLFTSHRTPVDLISDYSKIIRTPAASKVSAALKSFQSHFGHVLSRVDEIEGIQRS